MSILSSILERVGLLKGDHDQTTSPPQPGALSQQQIDERLAWMRSPQYQALRQATFDRLGIRVENAQPRNEPGEHEWLYSGGGR
jgi:hypothetical protein